jgi:hypothetical protein
VIGDAQCHATQLAVQEGKEAGVPQLDPPALAVELGERDEEVGEGGALAGEEVGEALREEAGIVFHEVMISRCFEPSPDGHIRAS